MFATVARSRYAKAWLRSPQLASDMPTLNAGLPTRTIDMAGFAGVRGNVHNLCENGRPGYTLIEVHYRAESKPLATRK